MPTRTMAAVWLDRMLLLEALAAVGASGCAKLLLGRYGSGAGLAAASHRPAPPRQSAADRTMFLIRSEQGPELAHRQISRRHRRTTSGRIHAAASHCTMYAAQPAPTHAGHGRHSVPASGQRLLAGALVAASLATGFNVLVQAAKALAQFWPPT